MPVIKKGSGYIVKGTNQKPTTKAKAEKRLRAIKANQKKKK